MRLIKFQNLSPAEAEEVITSVWVALEKNQLTAPKLDVIEQTDQLEITLAFDSEPACAIVTAEIQNVKYATSFSLRRSPSGSSLTFESL